MWGLTTLYFRVNIRVHWYSSLFELFEFVVTNKRNIPVCAIFVVLPRSVTLRCVWFVSSKLSTKQTSSNKTWSIKSSSGNASLKLEKLFCVVYISSSLLSICFSHFELCSTIHVRISYIVHTKHKPQHKWIGQKNTKRSILTTSFPRLFNSYLLIKNANNPQ